MSTFIATSLCPFTEPIGEPPRRLLTAADLAVLPDDLPSGAVKYELMDGELVIMSPPTEAHGAAQANIGSQLVMQGVHRGHGKAWLSVAVVVRTNPDCVYVPDAAFASHSSLPVVTTPDDYLLTPPDLVVEVRNNIDSKPYLARKVADYLAAGVRVVWVLDPAVQTVDVHRPNTPMQSLAAGDMLTIDEVIPNFAVRIADLFVT